MSEIEKDRAQHTAKRTAAGHTPPATSSRTQALLRHLGVEMYRERKRAEKDQPDSAKPAEEPPGR